jgi:hypothetical protein
MYECYISTTRVGTIILGIILRTYIYMYVFSREIIRSQND